MCVREQAFRGRLPVGLFRLPPDAALFVGALSGAIHNASQTFAQALASDA